MMRGFRSWRDALGVTLGGLGIAACFAAMVLAWIASAGVRERIDGLFGKMDGSLSVVGQRLGQARGAIDGATLTTGKLEATLREKAKLEPGQRAAWRLRVAEQSARLSSALDQADRWLEWSESFVGLVKDQLLVSDSTGVPSDTTSLDQLLEAIAALRRQLGEAMECVGGIRERITEAEGAESREELSGPATRLAARTIATLRPIDSGLAKLASGLLVTQGRLEDTRSGIQRRILLVTWGVTLLLLWMGAGQVALCRLAWRRAEP